jgi:hypothetical protein
MDMRVERVVLETDRYRIVGDLHLPHEGYRSRLSDYLNRGAPEFIALTSVEIEPLDGGAGRERRDFIAVGRRQVALAYPQDGGDT